MNKPTYIALQIIAPIAIVGAGIGGFILLAGIKPGAQPDPKPPLPPLVLTALAEEHTDGLIIRAHGSVVPFRQIPLAAEVTGRIAYKNEHCKSGRFVKENEELFHVDREDYELEVERIEKEEAQALANVEEAKTEIASAAKLQVLAQEEFDEQDTQFKRIEKLFKDGIATQDQFDKSKQMRRQSNSALVGQTNQSSILGKRLHRFEKAYDLTGTMLKKAQLDLKRTTLRSPITGVIISEHVEEDSYVQRGTQLVLIADISRAEVVFNLRMEDLYWLWQHEDLPVQTSQDIAENTPLISPASVDKGVHPATWEVPDNVEVDIVYELGGQRFKWDGKLSRYEGTGLNSRTRTVPCRVIVERPTAGQPLQDDHDPMHTKNPPALVRGMFVSVAIKSKPRVPLIKIPERAVRPGNIVWRVRDGKLERLEVEIAKVANGQALVPATGKSIELGDHIVISPLATETSGQKVRESFTQANRTTQPNTE